ncbi:HIT family protein [Robiginitalea sp. SC105]|uniref:HIT family protein n=1 Tax=Robiginitalea sp. SC105 TaxID=2762332 RepID=UPI00163A5663|nr:HIT family protein [Robiginitalea sp. SC105]MBC2837940.1 HIT family protein [Robiginitalea sp. SC105]
MPSIFTRIINGELPCYKVAEDADHIAFLDVNPNSRGHTLCVPKKEVDKITDMEPEGFEALMRFTRRVALGIEAAVPCRRVGITVIGLEVPHVHVHLIPLNSMADATFQKKEKLDEGEFEEIAGAIRKQLG